VAVNHLQGEEERAREVVEAVERGGGKAAAVAADVSSEQDVGAMFEAAQEALGGPVDLLVNNAGIEMAHPLEEMPLEDWQKVLDVNLTGPFLCSRELVRRIGTPAKAVIVNVSSVHEVIPWLEFSHYCASKGGLKLFSQTIARELAPRGIRVASVAPGAILTPINKELEEDEDKRKAVEEEIPWGRLGSPEEVAGAISWLASDEAEYVVGSTVFVDGGMTLYPKFV
jgi:glucose 1-dehydrogenase